jgi:hypothetical protein
MDKKQEKLSHPKTPICTGNNKPEYGTIHNAHFCSDGSQSWVHVHPKDHKKSHRQKVDATGSYDIEFGDDDRKGYNLSLKHEYRGYCGGGSMSHCDGHSDKRSESTSRDESYGDQSHVTGKDRYRGTKGKVFKAEGPEAKINHGSSAVVHNGQSGSVNSTFEEDYHNHVQGNIVTMGEKNRVDLVQKDYAMNAGQNWDTYIKQKGKIETGQDFKLESGAKIEENAKNEFTMSSDQKIVIKVGQSKITIESGEIKIEGAKVTVKADGMVDIKGSATLVQGGGQVAPPTTFK